MTKQNILYTNTSSAFRFPTLINTYNMKQSALSQNNNNNNIMSENNKFDLADKILAASGVYSSGSNGQHGPMNISGPGVPVPDSSNHAPSPTGSLCSSTSGKDSTGSSIGESLKELTYTGLTNVDMCADMQNR